MPQSFYELDIWRIGYQLLLKVYQLTTQFPAAERYGLTDQLKRSANAIIALIAESQGRHSYNDRIRVLYQSRGGVFETRSHLKVATGLGYISESDFEQLDQAYQNQLIKLNAYIKFLANARSTN